MNAKHSIEMDGFEIELASELYCNQTGDHPGLVQRARTDLAQLGRKIDDLAVLCMECMKAILLTHRDSIYREPRY